MFSQKAEKRREEKRREEKRREMKPFLEAIFEHLRQIFELKKQTYQFNTT